MGICQCCVKESATSQHVEKVLTVSAFFPEYERGGGDTLPAIACQSPASEAVSSSANAATITVETQQQPASMPSVPLAGSPGDRFRGLSVDFVAGRFQEISGVASNSKRTVYDIEPLIRELSSEPRCPRDGAAGCAYVDVAPDLGAGRAQYMISYCWGYRVKDIGDALLTYCSSSNCLPSAMRAWICCLCINQHRVQQQRTQGDSLTSQDFAHVLDDYMRKIPHVLVLLSPCCSPLYVQRAWCLFELASAIEAGKAEQGKLEVLMPPDDETSFRRAVLDRDLDRFFKAFSCVRIQDSSASVESDKSSILRAIDKTATDFATSPAVALVNLIVTETIRASFAEAATEHLRASANTSLQAYSAVTSFLLQSQPACGRRAQLFIDKAVQLHSENGLALAEALGISGIACLLQGKPLLAEARYVSAIDALQKEGQTKTLLYANLLRNIGTVYLARNNHVAAQKHFKSAIVAYKAAAASDSLDSALLLANNALSLEKEGKVSAAEKYFQTSARLFQGSANACAAGADVLRIYGEFLLEQGSFDDAIREFKAAKSMYQKLGQEGVPVYIELLLAEGKAFSQLSRHEEALEECSRAQTFVELSRSSLFKHTQNKLGRNTEDKITADLDNLVDATSMPNMHRIDSEKSVGSRRPLIDSIRSVKSGRKSDAKSGRKSEILQGRTTLFIEPFMPVWHPSRMNMD